MNDGHPVLCVDGETLLLHPERAVLWPARQTVIIADAHFGKSAIFRRNGVAVPAGSDALDRERIDRLLSSTAAQRLIVLGDFLHAPLEEESQDVRELAAWSDMHPKTAIHVVAGNHDRGMSRKALPAIRWHDHEIYEPPFRFTHDGEQSAEASSSIFTLCGHVHPVAKIGHSHRRGPRVPVFWRRRHALVLPSFGIFTGGYLVHPGPHDEVYAAGPERVVRFR